MKKLIQIILKIKRIINKNKKCNILNNKNILYMKIINAC